MVMLELEGKTVHFIGVGGISCNALARFVLDFGGKVSGSDAKITPICNELRQLGATIYQGENPNNVNADIAVFSTAIKRDNAELQKARELGVPIYERHEFLGEISKLFGASVAVAGTHGKTSTTAMLTHILKKRNFPFLSMIGGECVSFGNYVNNTCVHKISELKDCVFIAEACEYKRHMLSVKSDVGVVTNVECDHPDCYADITEVRDAFRTFLEKSKVKIASCEDMQNLFGIADKNPNEFCVTDGEKKFTFRLCDKNCEVYENGIYRTSFSLIDDGEYNYKNALFALCASSILGVPLVDGASALKSYKGVKRRFERSADIGNSKVFFDFAHHPKEISCVLERAKKYGKVLIVFQPHTYSRTKAYLDEFVQVLGECDFCDDVVLMPVYAARETPSMGVDSDVLAKAIFDKFPQKKVYLAKDAHSTLDYVKSHAKGIDVIMMIGAGDIYDIKRLVECEKDKLS